MLRMKAVKIIFAVLAAVWAIALVPKLMDGISKSGDPLMLSRAAGSVLGIGLASAVSIMLFRSACSKKPGNYLKETIVGLVVVGLFVIISGVGYFVINRYRGATNIPADLATRPWSEHRLIGDSVIMDVPWPLNTKETVQGKESKCLSNQGDGLYVLAGCSQSSLGGEELDALVDGFVAICQKDSETAASPAKTATTVIGDRAIELEMVLKKKWKTKGQFRGLFFIHNGMLCQIHCTSGLNQPVADAVWKRIKESIKLRQASATLPKTGITRGTLPLPPGMTPRQK